MPEDIDAIQVMTIHKAKGLDFPVVIVDAANVKRTNTKNEYWEDINLTEFEDLKVGLFPLTRKIEHINKGHIYEQEVAKTELDFLNLIYVAFTRPIKVLYTIAQVKSGNPRDKFADYMIYYLKNKGLWEDDKMSYSFGELTHSESTTEKSSSQIIKLNTFIKKRFQGNIETKYTAKKDIVNSNKVEKIYNKKQFFKKLNIKKKYIYYVLTTYSCCVRIIFPPKKHQQKRSTT